MALQTATTFIKGDLFMPKNSNKESTTCASTGQMCVIPTLTIKGADKAIEQYKKAFGAVEEHMMRCPESGVVAHCGLKIGASMLFITEENKERGCVAATNQTFYLYVPDADEAMTKAIKAGLKETQKAEDMFWGDRMGVVTDAAGIKWSLATHVRDVSPKEMEAAMKKMAGKAA
jgi:PhnB protein